MYVLGIETSCDETAASIVRDGKKVLSNRVSSSLPFHREFGGIVPEIASRMQLETISEVTQAAIKEAGVKVSDIGLISVTCGPGLLGSLFVGVCFAKSLAYSLGVPLVGVNHIYSHIYAAILSNNSIRLPFVALVVSGGHTSLFYVKDFKRIELLGKTQDDACGEAFDKVAKLLGLGYPGGPLIEKLASQGNDRRFVFKCSGTKAALNFSFSGIKTAVLYTVRPFARSPVRPLMDKRDNGHTGKLDKQLTKDIAASFQRSVIDVLIKKSLSACKTKKVGQLVVGGGVVANNTLRQRFMKQAASAGIYCYFPSKTLSTDNAAMVAGLGFMLFEKRHFSDFTLSPDVN